jgi:hypothetical protein
MAPLLQTLAAATLFKHEDLLAEVEDVLRTMPPRESLRSPTPETLSWFGRAVTAITRWNGMHGVTARSRVGQILGTGSGYSGGPDEGYTGLMALVHEARADLRFFQVCCAILDDHRKLIAAGKVQRWEVLKWAMTVNLVLATASITLGTASTRGGILGLSILVAVVGALVILYYNDRMTNARNDSVRVEEYLVRNGVDIAAITGKKPERVGFWYDLEDLAVSWGVLGLSVLIVWWFK